jgi:SAM-dependent methyltransferase
MAFGRIDVRNSSVGPLATNNGSHGTADGETLLHESAPLARKWAEEGCDRDETTGERCSWYHGVWQYLRILGIVASPRLQYRFYESALQGPAARGAFKRVLISGSTDYGMLEVVSSIYGSQGGVLEATVVDRCDTPLRLNRWYADRFGLTLNTCRSDLLAFQDQEPFDLICTHSFLGNFSPAQRPGLFSQWHSLLRPGGRLVMVNRIRPGAPGQVGFSSSQAEAFVQRVRDGAVSIGQGLDISSNDIVQWAREYTERYRTHPLTSKEEFWSLLHGSGFEGELIDPGESADRGPSDGGEARRAFLVATRR